MLFENVCIEAVEALLPQHIVSSEEIERRLAPVYERLHLPAGRLELMTGIRERRFFPPGTLPGGPAAEVAKAALRTARIVPSQVGALIHGSVCRDQMEPATAAGVHHALGLPATATFIDVSNACLGLINGMLLLAEGIEAGRFQVGVVTGAEIGGPLVDGTIDRLLKDEAITRKSIKLEFASLTIGSGAAAIVLTHKDISRSGHRLLGAVTLADTSSHRLCHGGNLGEAMPDGQPSMSTDSEALLHAGVNLAEQTWRSFLSEMSWARDDIDRVFTHQVGRAHRKLLLERLGLAEEIDFPTVEFLGNTGAVALPMAWSLGIEAGHVRPGQKVALLGIGSGLSSTMAAVEW
jgi:3-oxoacyl-[acyl-carrier-protein] synthase-3